MKFILKFFLSLSLCIASLAALASAQQGTAQRAQPQAAAARAVVAKLLAKKSADHPLTIITPSDLAGLTQNEREALTLLADPCDTALPIDVAQTIAGALTNTDCRLDDGSYADLYTFNGTAGQQVTVSLSSTAFDTFLGLANEAGTYVVGDDNGGGGTDSRIVASLPETGVYIILANSLLADQFGPYSLSLASVPVCTYSLEPTSASVPGAGGTFTFMVNTQPGCGWGTYYDIYSFLETVTPSGNGPGPVSYRVSPNNSGASRSTTILVNGHVFSIQQDALNCSFSLTPQSADLSPDEGTYTFQVNTSPGCQWYIPYPQSNWLWAYSEVRFGPGTVSYVVQANNGPSERTGTVTAANLNFTVRQAGRNCTYSVTPTQVSVPQAGQQGQFVVDTQAGCTWAFGGGGSTTYFPDGGGGTGPGTKNYIVYPNYQQGPRSWNITFIGNDYTNIVFTQSGTSTRAHRFDFDGDGRTDISVYRPSEGAWYLQQATAGIAGRNFGLQTDRIVPADYDGDGKTDIAVYRPDTGIWYVVKSSDGSVEYFNFGLAEDLPAPADYDGDGKADICVFRPSNATWYRQNSSDGSFFGMQFGAAGDIPAMGDFDGDGKADISVYRPATGDWYRVFSSTGNSYGEQLGSPGDLIVPADYDGDGRTDIGVFRPSDGYWYMRVGIYQLYRTFPFGQAGDIPAVGDYDGDGNADVTVFRPSDGTWYRKNSTDGSFSAYQFGTSGDQPTQAAFRY